MGLAIGARTDVTLKAEQLVRDSSQFKWYAVALLAFVIYAYANEVERGRYDIIAAGLAIWFADWFNEIVNALVLQASDRAPLWATTGPTAYQFLVGLNVEISFMFALAGIVYVKLLPADRTVRILRMPNRFAVALGLSIVSVAVELFLHASGTFHWHWWWWNVASAPVIVVFGYLWFYLFAAWVYDAPTQRARWTRVGGLAAIDVAMGLVFGVGFGWL
jgi:cytochrome c biogenesis protein CcdA